MSKEVEHLVGSKEIENKVNYVFSNLPDLIEDNISDKLLVKIGKSISEKRLVIFVGPHQGYLESEIWALISGRLSDLCPDFNGLYLPYSEPASKSNVDKLLTLRKDYYSQKKLHILPVVRESDKNSEQYRNAITPEMESRSNLSMAKMASARRNNCAIIALPEGSIKAGRIDPNTGQIFGMQSPKEKTFLDLIFTKKEDSINRLISHTDIVPIGIDGSYKVLSSDNYQFSEQIPIWLKNKEKVVTINAKEIIHADKFSSLVGSGKNVVEIIMRDKVAPLLSPLAQGIYRNNKRISFDRSF